MSIIFDYQEKLFEKVIQMQAPPATSAPPNLRLSVGSGSHEMSRGNESFVKKKMEEHDQIKNNIIEGLQKAVKQKDDELRHFKE